MAFLNCCYKTSSSSLLQKAGMIRSEDLLNLAEESNFVNAVQKIFHDVCYLKFNPATKLSLIPQDLCSAMVARGSCHFQNKEIHHQ